MRLYTVYYISVNCSLYMFWMVTPPIIRSTYNCNYSTWHCSNHLCYLPLLWSSWNCSSNCSNCCHGAAGTAVPTAPTAVMKQLELQFQLLSWSSWNCSSNCSNCCCGAVGTAPWQQKVAETIWPVPDIVITVICASDDGWSYHPKQVEWAVYRNIINCI